MASVVFASHHRWDDEHWMAARRHRDPVTERISVYELHLGSWRRVARDGNRSLH